MKRRQPQQASLFALALPCCIGPGGSRAGHAGPLPTVTNLVLLGRHGKTPLSETQPICLIGPGQPCLKALGFAAGVRSYAGSAGLPASAALAAWARPGLRPAGSLSLFSSRAFTATRKLEPDMDRAAISGRRTRPMTGSKTPAAMGSARVL